MGVLLEVNATEIAMLQDRLTVSWHDAALETWRPPEAAWTAVVARQHLANYELWHTEDAARTPGATDADLARVKRRIDATNQRRNDLSEQIDRLLLEALEGAGLPAAGAELHSESPGLMVDRLSILALKLYHTREELERVDAPAGHVERNRTRYAVLEEQRTDLAGCLDRLWAQTLAGERRFKLYQQLKMYNDPALNPAVYRNASATSKP